MPYKPLLPSQKDIKRSKFNFDDFLKEFTPEQRSYYTPEQALQSLGDISDEDRQRITPYLQEAFTGTSTEYPQPEARTPEQRSTETPFLSPEQPMESPATIEGIQPEKTEEVDLGASTKEIAKYAGLSEEYIKSETDILEGNVSKVYGELRFNFANMLREKYKDNKFVLALLGRETEWGNDAINSGLNFFLKQDHLIRTAFEKKTSAEIFVESSKDLLEAAKKDLASAEGGMSLGEQLDRAALQAEDPTKRNYIDIAAKEREAAYSKWLDALPKSLRMINAVSKYLLNTALFVADNFSKNVKYAIGTGAYLADGYSFDESFALSKVLGTSAWERIKRDIPIAFGFEGKEKASKFWKAPLTKEGWEHLATNAKERHDLASAKRATDANIKNLTETEMISRYRAGEDPHIIATEIENPLAEAAIESVFDPTNYIGGYLTDLAAAKRLLKAKQSISVEHGGVMSALLWSKGSDTLKSTKILDKMLQVSTEAARASRELLGRTFGLDVLTDAGKRNEFRHMTHDVVMAIAGESHPLMVGEDLLDYVKIFGHTDEAERLAALAKMKKHKAASAIFSPDGRDTGALLYDLLKDSKGRVTGGVIAEMLEVAAKDKVPVAKFLELLDPWMDTRLGRFFPSYSQFIKQTDKITEALKSGKKVEDLSPALKRLLVDGKPATINPGIRFLIEADDKLKPARMWTNKVMAKFYFNTFAFVGRNAYTTFEPMLVDEGFDVVPFLDPKRQAYTQLKLGVPSQAKSGVLGLGTQGAIDTKTLAGKGKMFDKITNVGMTASNNVEKWLAGAITSRVQQKVWRNGTAAMMRYFKDALISEAGLSEKDIKLLQTAMNSELDLADAVKLLSGGQVYPNLTVEDIDFLRKTDLMGGLLDDYRAASLADDPAKALKQLSRKRLRRWRKVGNQALKESVPLDFEKHVELQAEHGIDLKAVDEKLLSKEQLDLTSRKRASFYNAHDYFSIKTDGVKGQFIKNLQWISDNLVDLEKANPGSTKKFIELNKNSGWFTTLAQDTAPIDDELKKITPQLQKFYEKYVDDLSMGVPKDEAWDFYKSSKENYLAETYEKVLGIEKGIVEKYYPVILEANQGSPIVSIVDTFSGLSSDAIKMQNVDELAFIQSRGYCFPKGTVQLTDESAEMLRLWDNVEQSILQDNPKNKAIALERLEKSVLSNATPEELERWEDAWAKGSDADISAVVDDIAFRMSGAVIDDGDVIGVAEDVAKAEKASVKFMVTNADKAKLKEMGYTPEQIKNMNPQEVGKILGQVGESPKVKPVKPINNPQSDLVAPSARRATKENVDGVDQYLYNLVERQTFEKTDTTKNWAKVIDILEDKAAETKALGLKYSDMMREKTAHDYGKRYGIDGALAWVYPFQFWYSRTYYQWIKRIAEKPALLAGYARGRAYEEKIHAGWPDWMKYSINTKELGLTEDAVLLPWEATLNPLYGLVGADFEDANKQADWLPATLDNLGKFGPSTYTPFSMAIAMYYVAKGEQDKARVWGGSRLIPLTSTIRGATALMGMNKGKGVELDPVVGLLERGQTWYDERAISAKLVDAAINQVPLEGIGVITLDQVFGASDPNMRKDPKTGYEDQAANSIWNAGVALWMKDPRSNWLGWKSTQMLMGSTLGIGFKGYSEQDILTNQAYREYEQYSIGDAELSPADSIKFNAQFNEKYQFWEPMLLTRKAGIARDRAYAYSVLGRIPPGEVNKYTDLIGVPAGLLDKFYSTKGHFEYWNPNDYAQFVGAIGNLATILATPANTVRHDWNQARIANSEMTAEMQKLYGADIMDKIGEYYDFKNDDESEEYLANNPEVQKALDWKSDVVQRDPVLQKYYGGLWTYEQWLNSIVNQQADIQFEPTTVEGKSLSIRQLYAVYVKLEGEDATRFLNTYPQVGEYKIWRKEQRNAVGIAIEKAAELFPEQPTGIIRPDYQPQNDPQRQLFEYIETQKEPGKVMADALERASELKSDTAGDFELTQYVRLQSEKLWPGVMNKREEYYALKKINPSKAAAYLAENLDLRAQMDYQDTIEGSYYSASKVQDVQGNIVDFPTILGNSLYSIVLDWKYLGKEIPDKQMKKLKSVADQYGISVEELLDRIT